MPVTNVTSVWSSGCLVFQDSTGAEIGYWDGVNRKFVLTSGANFDFSAATGSVTLATGEITAADLADSTVTSAKVSPLYGKMLQGSIAAVTITTSGALFAFQPTTATPSIIDGFWLLKQVVATSSAQIIIGVAASATAEGTNLLGYETLSTTGLVGGLVGTTAYVEASATEWITGWTEEHSSGFVGKYIVHYWGLTT